MCAMRPLCASDACFIIKFMQITPRIEILVGFGHLDLPVACRLEHRLWHRIAYANAPLDFKLIRVDAAVVLLCTVCLVLFASACVVIKSRWMRHRAACDSAGRFDADLATVSISFFGLANDEACHDRVNVLVATQQFFRR